VWASTLELVLPVTILRPPGRGGRFYRLAYIMFRMPIQYVRNR
jgi:hypothetical protein